MKLYRFTASTTQKAILAVHDSLGANALVYSTRKIADGIEVLAGLPFEVEEEEVSFDESDTIVKKSTTMQKKSIQSKAVSAKVIPNKIKVENTVLDQKAIETLKAQVQAMTENLRILSENISLVHQLLIDEVVNKKTTRWGIFKKLPKINIRTGLYGYKSIFKK